jgi:general stress protein 26
MHPRLYEELREFAVAMVITHRDDGSMVAFPTTVARVERGGRLYFVAADVRGRLADPQVTVVFQRKDRYVAVRGVAHVSLDRAHLAALWNEAWRTFFPAGRDDPALALLIVDPTQAESWNIAPSAEMR